MMTMHTERYILVAEDDADDRFLLQTAFAEKGFPDRIEFVEDGVELLEFLDLKANSNDIENGLPGFILLDLNMPKKDGRQALEEIKQNPRYKNIPVIVYTTTKNEHEIKHCYELGANTYIVKPVRFDMLLQTVEVIRTYWFNIASIPN